jgi:ankyrin repeat protein
VTGLKRILLRLGARIDKVSFVKTALKWGAPIDAVYGGRTALQTATYFGNESVVEFLIAAGANVNKQIAGVDSSALHLAADRGYGKLLVQLLQHGADPNVQNRHGSTPIHLAMIDGQPEIVAALLKGGALIPTSKITQDTLPYTKPTSRIDQTSSHCC